MATFSENQVRQLYVVNSASDFDAAGGATGLFFKMKDANGKPIRSDILTNILSAAATKADKMQRKTKVVKIAMDSNVNSGNPIAGEDYTIRIEYSNFIAQSDETFYHEFGSAHAITGMTAVQLYKALAANLALNIKKQEMVSVALSGSYGSPATAILVPLKVAAFSATTAYAIGDLVEYTDGKTYRFNQAHTAGAWNAAHVDEVTIDGVLISEIEQPWVLGFNQDTDVKFSVRTGTVTYNGDELAYGTVTDVTTTFGTTIGNGKKTADMEYFYHGNRGDIYRGNNYPNLIHTKYMVDPTKEYHFIDIHYAYVGDNQSVQKSEKTLTIAVPKGTSGSELTAVNAIIGEINTAYGSTLINTLS